MSNVRCLSVNSPVLAFEVFDDPPQSALLAVESGLQAHNHAAAPVANVRPVAAFAKLQTGEIAGGAVGRTWGACFELLELWVHPDHRGVGAASRLLLEVEQRATARGCRIFYLTTLSFQAPEFYRKHGYSALAEISGYPEGIVKYLMHKATPEERGRDT